MNEYSKKDKITVGIIIGCSVLFLVIYIAIIVVVCTTGKRAILVTNVTVPKAISDLKKAKVSPIRFFSNERSNLSSKYKSDDNIWNSTIFVSISSYRDPELCFTIKDMFQKALNTSRITVGIVQQNDKTDNLTCFAQNAISIIDALPGSFSVIDMDYKEARGPTHARAICEKLLKNEKYYFLIDSHMRFEPGWDCELIRQLYLCPRPQRTILTIYPTGYFRKQKGDKITYTITRRHAWKRQRIRSILPTGIVQYEALSGNRNPKNPRYVPFFSGCFAFSVAEAVKEVPYPDDTPDLFLGEEMFMGARFFTHGWDLKSPTHNLAFHLWKSNMQNYRRLYTEVQNVREQLASVWKVVNIMSGTEKNPKFKLGTVKSILDYWKYIGIDFQKKTYTRPKEPWKLPSDFKPIRDKFLVCPDCEILN